jgi:hypothetical protein
MWELARVRLPDLIRDPPGCDVAVWVTSDTQRRGKLYYPFFSSFLRPSFLLSVPLSSSSKTSITGNEENISLDSASRVGVLQHVLIRVQEQRKKIICLFVIDLFNVAVSNSGYSSYSFEQ